MDFETLSNKLLSLGSSGKDFKGGSVGGFGKAKEILYFAHKSYRIESGQWRVEGSGAGYNLDSLPFVAPGTKSQVLWEGDVREPLKGRFRKFAALSNYAGRIILNGEELTDRAKRLRSLRTVEVDEGEPWGRVDRVQGEPGSLVVRVGGIPMFERHTDYKAALAVEVLLPSSTVLTSNRDGLKWEYRSQLDEMVKQLSVDRRSALRVEQVQYIRFGGPKLARPLPVVAEGQPGSAVGGTLVMVAAKAAPEKRDGGLGIVAVAESRTEEPQSILGHEFIIKNGTRRRIPPAFNPDSLRFDDHAHWLVKGWAGSLLELHRLRECDDHFSVGFLFSEDCEAEFERSAEYGPVYFLNPVDVGKRGRFVRRYTKDSRFQIAAIAAHEFVHGGMGEKYHDEDYAGKLTDLMGLVLAHWRRFARHFG